MEDAGLCHCTGCVHTPGTQTENRPLRETERTRESVRDGGKGGGEVAKKENGGGERDARNLRASVLQLSFGV